MHQLLDSEDDAIFHPETYRSPVHAQVRHKELVRLHEGSYSP